MPPCLVHVLSSLLGLSSGLSVLFLLAPLAAGRGVYRNLIYVIVIVVTLAGLALYVALNYRSLADERKAIDALKSKLDALLVRRHEFVGRLASEMGADGNSKTPGGELTAAGDAARAASGQPADERGPIENELSAKIGKFFHDLGEDKAVVASDLYLTLRDETIALQDDILLTVDEYNRAVSGYNAQRNVFPASIIAAKLNLPPGKPIELEDAFTHYPIKLAATLPTKRTTFPGMEPPKAKKGKPDSEEKAAHAAPARKEESLPGKSEAGEKLTTAEPKSAEKEE